MDHGATATKDIRRRAVARHRTTSSAYAATDAAAADDASVGIRTAIAAGWWDADGGEVVNHDSRASFDDAECGFSKGFPTETKSCGNDEYDEYDDDAYGGFFFSVFFVFAAFDCRVPKDARHRKRH